MQRHGRVDSAARPARAQALPAVREAPARVHSPAKRSSSPPSSPPPWAAPLMGPASQPSDPWAWTWRGLRGTAGKAKSIVPPQRAPWPAPRRGLTSLDPQPLLQELVKICHLQDGHPANFVGDLLHAVRHGCLRSVAGSEVPETSSNANLRIHLFRSSAATGIGRAASPPGLSKGPTAADTHRCRC